MRVPPLIPSARRRGGLARRCALLVLSLALVPPAFAASDADPVLARVNAYEIRQSEVLRSIESLPLGDQIEPRQQMDTYARALVQEEIVFQSVVGKDFRDAPELREQIRDIVFRFMLKRHVTDRIHVTVDQARDYYKANPDLVRGEHLQVRIIVRNGRADCERLQGEIHSVEQFMEAAKRLSLDARTAPEGGDFGYVMRAKGSLGFELELFNLKPGQMAVFESGQSCYLAWIVEHIDPPVPPFILVRDDILAFLSNQEEQRLLTELIESAQHDVSVEYFRAAAVR
jgi:hypothetical protein